ncbi:hypothetical protein [Anaerobranca gottschalkii]|uniref:Ig-like domain (Group 3) n=1 Tax=Anaerobranca gottschalkii DSM 13577 TaxID=1120990 RepID=A0A1I0AMM2_9FIRM|nr:hypothetical protein [Anaerobranca gottschalkii]SES94990.1 hypothetical protein SAMN03080614_102331 [Anaerobranca gottschalkii DSM 13577]
MRKILALLVIGVMIFTIVPKPYTVTAEEGEEKLIVSGTYQKIDMEKGENDFLEEALVAKSLVQKDNTGMNLENLYVANDDEYWYIGFEGKSDWGMMYGIYIDIDGVPGSGGHFNPWGRNVPVIEDYYPEFAIHAWSPGGTKKVEPAQFITWTGESWDSKSLKEVNGKEANDVESGFVKYAIPHEVLGNPDSIRVFLFIAGGDGVPQDVVPGDQRISTGWMNEIDFQFDKFVEVKRAEKPVVEPLYLSIEGPRELKINKLSHTFKGETNGESLKVNDVEIPLIEGTFEVEVMLMEGENEFVFLAIRGEEEKEEKITVWVNTEPVTIEIIQPIEEITTSQPLIEIIGKTNGDQVLINGLEVPLNEDGEFRYNVALIAGENIITIHASNRYGSAVSQLVKVIYEKPQTKIIIDGNIDEAYGEPVAIDPKGDMKQPDLDLHRLFVTDDSNFWYIGLDSYLTNWGVTYGIYIDTDNVKGSGGTTDPWGRKVGAVEEHLPNFILYIWRNGDGTINTPQLWKWNNDKWEMTELDLAGGASFYSPENEFMEFAIPKVVLGNPEFINLIAFTTGGDGIAQDTTPSDPAVEQEEPIWGAIEPTILSAFVKVEETVAGALSLVVEAPEDGLLTNKKQISVKGQTNGDRVYVNDSLVEIGENGRFIFHLTLKEEGEHQVIIKAVRGVEELTVTRKIFADFTPPLLEVTTPTKDMEVDSQDFTVKGKVEIGAILYVNGEETEYDSDGNFEKTIRLISGVNQVIIRAVDKAGNITEKTFKITFKAATSGPTTIKVDGINDFPPDTVVGTSPAGSMSEPHLDLRNFYVTDDNQYWYFGFDAYLKGDFGKAYGIYIDIDGKKGSGGTTDPWGRKVAATEEHLPEYIIYVWYDSRGLQNAQFITWTGNGWDYKQLVDIGGKQGHSENFIEYGVPKLLLNNVQSFNVILFTVGGDGTGPQDSAPKCPAITWSEPKWNIEEKVVLSNFAKVEGRGVEKILTLLVENPAEDLQTDVDNIEIRGRVTEGAKVTINGIQVEVKEGVFSQKYKLVKGENNFKITAVLDEQKITITRKVIYVPPRNINNFPKEALVAQDPAGDINAPNLDLTTLYVMDDELYWYIGFHAPAGDWGLAYGLYFDVDNVSGSGGTSDPWARAIKTVPEHHPEYVIYAWHNENRQLEPAKIYSWTGENWRERDLGSYRGAKQEYSAGFVKYTIPKAALGYANQFYISLFTTGGDGPAQDTVPSDPNVKFTEPKWDANYFVTLSKFAFVEANYPIEPPKLEILSPSDGSYVNTPTITIKGVTEIDAKIFVGELEIKVDENGKFQFDYTLDEGENIITIIAKDSRGIENQVDLLIYLDTEPPKLILNKDYDGMVVEEAELIIAGKTSLDAQVFINGEKANLQSNGVFTLTIQLEEGENVIEIKAVDRAGNERVKTITVTYNPPKAKKNTGLMTGIGLGLIFVLGALAFVFGKKYGYIGKN